MSDLNSTSLLGETAEISKTITDADIREFSRLSLDDNPIHLDDSVAGRTIFKKRVAHGLYVGSFISAVLAKKLPGPGTIYLKQEFDFKRPVFIGDTITARVKVVEYIKPDVVRLETLCLNQENERVIEGFALVKIT